MENLGTPTSATEGSADDAFQVGLFLEVVLNPRHQSSFLLLPYDLPLSRFLMTYVFLQNGKHP
jgi:hypothetical protein